MAEEKTNEADGQVDDTTAAAAGSTDADKPADDQTKVVPTPSEAEQRLTEQMSDLQGKFDTLSQGSEKDRQLLEELQPYVDWDKMKQGRDGGTADTTDEDNETFMTRAEAKAFKKEITEQIKTSDFVRDFRTNFPDLADKGPKEEMVRYFFENKTPRGKSHAERVEAAVKATRNMLKSEQDKGSTKATEATQKAAQEAKAKSEAAAKASGLDSAGITSPKTTDEKDTESTSDYIASRKARLEKIRTNR